MMNRGQLSSTFRNTAFVLLCLAVVFPTSAEQGLAAAPANLPADAHAQQAASSVIAATKQQVRAAESDEEAVSRVQVAIESLRLIGMLGDRDTEPQTAQLLDDLQRNASPQFTEALVQLRFARHMRDWANLPPETRKAALDRFVADVNRTGLTVQHATLITRIADLLEAAGDGPLAANAIQELLPAFRSSRESRLAERAPVIEGMVRRLNLVGKPLELEGMLLDGSQLNWDTYRGKVVLVDFFASWCGECRAEVPNVMQNFQAYKDKGFEVVGVNMDDQRQLAESYRQQTGFQFPTLFSDDPNATGWDHPMGRKYGILALPRAILVDQNGIVVDTIARGERLGQKLSELLGPPPTSSNSEPLSAKEPQRKVVPTTFEKPTPSTSK